MPGKPAASREPAAAQRSTVRSAALRKSRKGKREQSDRNSQLHGAILRPIEFSLWETLRRDAQLQPALSSRGCQMLRLSGPFASAAARSSGSSHGLHRTQQFKKLEDTMQIKRLGEKREVMPKLLGLSEQLLAIRVA